MVEAQQTAMEMERCELEIIVKKRFAILDRAIIASFTYKTYKGKITINRLLFVTCCD
jgi:hypothetical protein